MNSIQVGNTVESSMRRFHRAAAVFDIVARMPGVPGISSRVHKCGSWFESHNGIKGVFAQMAPSLMASEDHEYDLDGEEAILADLEQRSTSAIFRIAAVQAEIWVVQILLYLAMEVLTSLSDWDARPLNEEPTNYDAAQRVSQALQLYLEDEVVLFAAAEKAQHLGLMILKLDEAPEEESFGLVSSRFDRAYGAIAPKVATRDKVRKSRRIKGDRGTPSPPAMNADMVARFYRHGVTPHSLFRHLSEETEGIRKGVDRLKRREANGIAPVVSSYASQLDATESILSALEHLPCIADILAGVLHDLGANGLGLSLSIGTWLDGADGLVMTWTEPFEL